MISGAEAFTSKRGGMLKSTITKQLNASCSKLITVSSLFF